MSDKRTPGKLPSVDLTPRHWWSPFADAYNDPAQSSLTCALLGMEVNSATYGVADAIAASKNACGEGPSLDCTANIVASVGGVVGLLGKTFDVPTECLNQECDYGDEEDEKRIEKFTAAAVYTDIFAQLSNFVSGTMEIKVLCGTDENGEHGTDDVALSDKDWIKHLHWIAQVPPVANKIKENREVYKEDQKTEDGEADDLQNTRVEKFLGLPATVLELMERALQAAAHLRNETTDESKWKLGCAGAWAKVGAALLAVPSDFFKLQACFKKEPEPRLRSVGNFYLKKGSKQRKAFEAEYLTPETINSPLGDDVQKETLVDSDNDRGFGDDEREELLLESADVEDVED